MRPVLFLPIVFVLFWMPASSIAGPVAEAFVQQKAAAGLAILRDETLSDTEKNQQFGQFIDQVIDSRKVARFVLGKYARGIKPKVFDPFKLAFDAYAKSIYQDNLSQYGGESFVVTGSIDRKPGDVIVSSIISSGALKEPIKVRWRVRTKDGVSKIIDLEAFGIWLAVQQRSEITTFIANHGGDVGAATDMLNARVGTPTQVNSLSQ